MKKLSYLLGALALGLFASCQNEFVSETDTTLPDGDTYMSVTLNLPRGNGSTRASTGTYEGFDRINTLDVYLLSSDGQTLLYSHSYSRDAGEVVYNGQTITLAEPFATTPGEKRLIAVINCPLPPLSAAPAADYTYTLSSALALDDLASTSTDPAYSKEVDGYGTVYADITVMSGRSAGTFTIADNVTSQDVITNGLNHVAVNLTRVASRVAVTTDNLTPTVVNDAGTTLGTISDITWSVAQGENKVYLFPQFIGGTTTVVTSGYNYVPGTDYASTAPGYYDYTDLSNTADTVALNPGAAYVQYLPGKFLLENTHPADTTQEASGYRQGNTAYALVRVKFVPDPAAITDGGALAADSTFYVGATDGRIYSNMNDAITTTSGQEVYTYTGGKMLYYLWLNPDAVDKPINSPVVRNSIYHINIRSFKDLGVNWNPLDPSTDNPDPRPTDPNEPDGNPMDPTFPLSPINTYMTVDATVLPWNTYSYEIDL